MQTDAEVAAIAAKLGKGAIRVLTTHDDRVHSVIGLNPNVLIALFGRGLIAELGAAGHTFFRLTDLGTRVAQHLKQENSNVR